MRQIRVCMAGFGHVGRRFCLLLEEKKEYLAELGWEILVTGIATGSHGALVDAEGLPAGELAAQAEAGCWFGPDHPAFLPLKPEEDAVGHIQRASRAEVFVELTPLSISDGEPAAGHIRSALRQGMDVITANKGPLAWQYRSLKQEAAAAGRRFYYETVVMDGTPIFNLVERTLPGCRVLGLCGILNGTSNLVLQYMERGVSREAAIREAQRLGLAEADPSMDMDGWDGAAKLCALVNGLMGREVHPNQVRVESLSIVTGEALRAARRSGACIKYLCRAVRQEDALLLTVKPERIPLGHPLAAVDGTSAALELETDLAGPLTILQKDPGLLQTAYGVYSDLLSLLQEKR